jgi:hypothetical protein
LRITPKERFGYGNAALFNSICDLIQPEHLISGASMAKSLTPEKPRELARDGAELALNRLRAEIIAIERTFPELALPQKRHALRRSLQAATNRTSRMSAAARKAVSERMKRYWAERRKAKAKVR